MVLRGRGMDVEGDHGSAYPSSRIRRGCWTLGNAWDLKLGPDTGHALHRNHCFSVQTRDTLLLLAAAAATCTPDTMSRTRTSNNASHSHFKHNVSYSLPLLTITQLTLTWPARPSP